jgi:hypothetical protein
VRYYSPNERPITNPGEGPSLNSLKPVNPPLGLKRVEHYALYILNSMAGGTNSGLSDADIDFAIDVAERLAKKLMERGHIQSHE